MNPTLFLRTKILFYTYATLSLVSFKVTKHAKSTTSHIDILFIYVCTSIRFLDPFFYVFPLHSIRCIWRNPTTIVSPTRSCSLVFSTSDVEAPEAHTMHRRGGGASPMIPVRNIPELNYTKSQLSLILMYAFPITTISVMIYSLPWLWCPPYNLQNNYDFNQREVQNTILTLN
jgi:hypothetical protein